MRTDRGKPCGPRPCSGAPRNGDRKLRHKRQEFRTSGLQPIAPPLSFIPKSGREF